MKMTGPADADQSVDLASVDLTDPRLYGEGEPHRVFHALRQNDPVHWQSVDAASGFWSVTRYDDVLAVLADPASFTSERGTLLNLLGKDDPAAGAQMAATDPPRHRYLRVPLGRWLRGETIERYAPLVQAEIEERLAPALEGETIDLAAAMMAISTAVGALTLGLPRSDWPMLTTLTTTAIAPTDPEYLRDGDAAVTLARAHRDLFGYFHEQIRHRIRAPGDDLVSLLLAIEFEGGQRLDVGGLVSNCYSLLLGASVTTPHVPSAMILELAETGRYPEFATHRKVFENGLDEALRWASPTNHFMRCATRDTKLRGRTIRAGDAVVVWLGSANRDENVFDHPYRFEIARNPNRHVAFGAGPHYCVGYRLARQTLRLFFETVVETVEDFELVAPADHLHSNFVAGIKHLHVAAQARRRPPAREGEPTRESVIR